MILQWTLVIIAGWAVVVSLSFLALYAVIIQSSRASRQEERLGDAGTPTGGIGPAQIEGDGE